MKVQIIGLFFPNTRRGASKKFRAFCAALAAVTFCTSITLWPDAAHASPDLGSMGSPVAAFALSSRKPWWGDIPREAGEVVESWSPDAARSHGSIIYLQDIHTHPQAQRHLEQIVGALHDRLGVRFFALEGWDGSCEIQRYSVFQNRPGLRDALNRLRDVGIFTGPETFGVLHPTSVELWGVEQGSLYREQLDWYRHSAQERAATLEALRPVEEALRHAEEKLLPPALTDAGTPACLHWRQFEKHRVELKARLRTSPGRSKHRKGTASFLRP